MAHLLPVVLAIVRQHVDNEQAAARLEDARDLGQRLLRLRHVMQHQHQRRRVEPGIVDRQRLELAAPEIDVVESVQALFAACSIAAEASTATTRATNGASAALTWPVPQPRSPTTQSASANAASAAR